MNAGIRSGLLIILVFITATSPAQEKFGIVNSNYHPVSSVHFNASSSVDSRAYMQLNLIGLNLWARTNAGYAEGFSYWSFAGSLAAPVLRPVDNRRSKFLYMNGVADGPSFIISKNKWGLGLFTRGRTVADLRRLPYQFTNLLLGVENPEQDESGEIAIRNARFSNMSWLEYGLNIGYMVYERRTEMITAGVNIKRLTGLNLQFLNLQDVSGSYTETGFQIDNFAGKYRSAPFVYGSGKGWGVDFGLTYKKLLSHVDGYMAHSRRSNCKFIAYKYKIGLSLRDAGYIRFADGTVRSDLQGSGLVSEENLSPAEMEERFRLERTEGGRLSAMPPLAVGGQLDYNFENNFYLSLDINKNLVPNNVTGVQSMDVIALVPRYETRLIEVALPLMVQRYIYPQAGLALRFRSLVIGVDNVVPLVMRRNTSSVGVYFNLAISLFRNPGCGVAGKIDDCTGKRVSKQKIRRKNTLISPRPRKETRERTH